MSFSERMGFTKAKTSMQIKSMDMDLRNSLWNILYGHVLGISLNLDSRNNMLRNFFIVCYVRFFKKTLDEVGSLSSEVDKLKEDFFNWEFHKVYSFIEFSVNHLPNYVDKNLVIKNLNHVLEVEKSGYRFLNDIFIPVTDNTSLDSIDSAISKVDEFKLSGVHAHLKHALGKFSDRKNPDYRNSIKESISAVESLVKIIAKSSEASLGEALKIIEKDKTVEINPALKVGFDKIYGYTSSGKEGIRHSMLEAKNIPSEDALFMLVSCSAFVNYLISKAIKSNIPLSGA
ncbi:MAG: hypothetical protein KAT05_06675 [Spirochaetes bacterium]|nr:hypothetical protein [Spirochaetota bacterium]